MSFCPTSWKVLKGGLTLRGEVIVSILLSILKGGEHLQNS